MNALENLLIIAGISLDIFAAMECQGDKILAPMPGKVVSITGSKDRQKTACQTVCTDCCMADGSAVRRKLPVRTFVP